MKKFGFTLAELLVAMGVIGIVAAITMPSLSQLRPDKNKLMVLKTYKTIVDTNKELLSDPSLYMSDGNCNGFMCIQLPTNPAITSLENNASYMGITKYAMLLARSLDTDSSPQPADNPAFLHFKTVDGTNWFVRQLNGSGLIIINVRFDGVDTMADGKTYDTNPSKPTMFSFTIPPESINLKGHDSLTKAYLENPNKLNDKKADYKRAKAIKDGDD